jgi:DNA modification methylase
MTEQSIGRVEHGDVFELLPSLETGFGHAAVVDFPWTFNGDNGTGRFEFTEADREFEVYQTEENDRLADVLDELARVLVDGAWVFVFADDDTQPEFRECLEDSPLTYRRTCVWDREKFGMGYYHRVQHYPILTATNGETDRYIQGRGTVYRAARNDFTAVYNDDAYPTSKPVKLYRQMLAKPVLKDGERLLEPFCGTGPGAAVTAQRGLGYWGADTNPDAVERARQQLEQTRLTQISLSRTGSGNDRSVDTGDDRQGGDS